MLAMASAAAVQQLSIGCGICRHLQRSQRGPCSSPSSSPSAFPSPSASACPSIASGCPQLSSRSGKNSVIRTSVALKRGRASSYLKRCGGRTCDEVAVIIGFKNCWLLLSPRSLEYSLLPSLHLVVGTPFAVRAEVLEIKNEGWE